MTREPTSGKGHSMSTHTGRGCGGRTTFSFFLLPPEKPIPGGAWTSVDVCSSGRDVFSILYCQTIGNESACPSRFLVFFLLPPEKQKTGGV